MILSDYDLSRFIIVFGIPYSVILTFPVTALLSNSTILKKKNNDKASNKFIYDVPIDNFEPFPTQNEISRNTEK